MKFFTPLFLTVVSITCLAGSANAATVFVLPGPPAPVSIPDNNPTGIQYSFSMPLASGTIQDIWIDLGLTHTWVGDLTATLTSPAGGSFDIFNRIGRITTGAGDSSNLGANYRFSDSGGNIWTAAASGDGSFVIPGGDYRTVGANSSVATSWASDSGFVGMSGLDAAGPWTLKISDLLGADLGTLGSGSLTITMSVSAIPEPGAILPLAVLIGSGFLHRSRRGMR